MVVLVIMNLAANLFLWQNNHVNQEEVLNSCKELVDESPN